MNVYATSVLTSITSQNTTGVDGIHDIPPEFVQKQLRAVLSDIGADAVKTGMLSSAAIIATVAETLQEFPEAAKRVVVDPVMVATSGSRLMAEEAVQTFIKQLLPVTCVLTPNVPEAEVFASQPIKTLDAMHSAAKAIARLGPQYVLLKGGHLPQDRNGRKVVVDILYDKAKDSFLELENPFVETKDTHGTGCTLSAAIAAELAKGYAVAPAVRAATTYIQEAIATSLGTIGKGCGPVNHFHNIRSMPYAGKSFVKALKDALPAGLWDEFLDHPFVRGMADGTLPKENFIYYIKQDYLYLQHYARSAALAAYKCKRAH